jgi:hypothetical protein
MIRIALVERSCEARSKYLEARLLPPFYEAELSRLSAPTERMPLRYEAELSSWAARTKLMPLRYMEDFSILGITVTDYPVAQAFMQQAGYIVTPCPGGGDIDLQHISHLPRLLEQLNDHGLDATFSDVADTIYQA